MTTLNKETTQTTNLHYYKEYKQEMILRDVLAADRTILANERTVLSYVRTSLNFAIAGISIIKIFNGWDIYLLGGLLILTSVIILPFGIKRYFKVRKDVNYVRK